MPMLGADGRRGTPHGSVVPLGIAFSVLAAAVVLVPPVIYQLQNFFFGWHDVGNYTRANYNFFEFGRFAMLSDGSGNFFAEQHLEPFFFLLCLPVRLFGTSGYVGAVTAAIVLAAGYVFALARAVTRSSWIGALCAAAYVANPYTQAIALSCHPETFGVLFLLAFAYHSYVGQSGRAWLALLLAFTVKEDMWVYAVVVALLVARRDRLRHTIAFVAAAICYYVVAILLIGGSWYPTANYFNSFYESEGHSLTKFQIALRLLGRWHEFIPLLFTGPGMLFQLSFLFVCILSGWRYVVACGVMLLWLTYPGGPPRSNFTFYYSYAAALVSFVVLPFALFNLRLAGAHAARRLNGARLGGWAVAVVMGLVLTTDVVMHLPGRAPEPIREAVDYRSVYGKGPGVNVPVVRSLITHYLTGDDGSVLAQFYTFPSIPQRRLMYLTFFDRRQFLEGQLRPKYVLMDLGAPDPWVPPEDLRNMVMLLRRGDTYRPLYDAAGVLLYQRVGHDGR